MRIKIAINCTAIVPIINEAWKKSFVKAKSNKQAIVMYGWKLMNRALLINSNILKTKPKPTTQLTVIEVQDASTADTIANGTNIAKTLHLENGLIGIVMTDLLQDALKQEDVTKNMEKRYAKGRTLCAVFANDKVTMIAGNIFKFNRIILDKDVLDLQT